MQFLMLEDIPFSCHFLYGLFRIPYKPNQSQYCLCASVVIVHASGDPQKNIFFHKFYISQDNQFNRVAIWHIGDIFYKNKLTLSFLA